jgi:hypothetical protein
MEVFLMADGKKSPKKPVDKAVDNKPAQEEGRKVNPWIPVAVVVAIIVLIAIMAAMNSNNSGTTATVDQAASGTTQSGGTGAAPSNVDVSWITGATTLNEAVKKSGIPAKMIQANLAKDGMTVTDADMDKTLDAIGGDKAIQSVVNIVAAFGGGGGMGGGAGGSTGGAPSGMGGTTTTP